MNDQLSWTAADGADGQTDYHLGQLCVELRARRHSILASTYSIRALHQSLCTNLYVVRRLT